MNHGKQLTDTNYPIPTCSCEAGKCILVTVRDGENAGRKYFACPIKKGQGACNHFQWYDNVVKEREFEYSDCLLKKPNLITQDIKDACKAISVGKDKDMIAQVSPLLQDQMFQREPQASKGEKELNDTHIFNVHGPCNNLQWFDSMTKNGKIADSDSLFNKHTPQFLDNKQACKAIDVIDAVDTVAPVSPLLRDQRDAFPQISPVKRLSLRDDSPDAGSSKLKRSLKFESEGHWLNAPSSPCYKCGRFGHSMCNCPAPFRSG